MTVVMFVICVVHVSYLRNRRMATYVHVAYVVFKAWVAQLNSYETSLKQTIMSSNPVNIINLELRAIFRSQFIW